MTKYTFRGTYTYITYADSQDEAEDEYYDLAGQCEFSLDAPTIESEEDDEEEEED